MEILVVMRTHHIIVIDIDAILLQKEVHVRVELLLPALAKQHEQTAARLLDVLLQHLELIFGEAILRPGKHKDLRALQTFLVQLDIASAN